MYFRTQGLIHLLVGVLKLYGNLPKRVLSCTSTSNMIYGGKRQCILYIREGNAISGSTARPPPCGHTHISNHVWSVCHHTRPPALISVAQYVRWKRLTDGGEMVLNVCSIQVMFGICRQNVNTSLICNIHNYTDQAKYVHR